MMRVTDHSKSIVAGVSTAITAAVAVLQTDKPWYIDALIVAGAFLGGAFPTWVVPTTLNKPIDNSKEPVLKSGT